MLIAYRVTRGPIATNPMRTMAAKPIPTAQPKALNTIYRVGEKKDINILVDQKQDRKRYMGENQIGRYETGSR